MNIHVLCHGGGGGGIKLIKYFGTSITLVNKNDPRSLDALCHHLFYGVSVNHKISEKLPYTSSELNYKSNFKLGTMASLQFKKKKVV